MNKFVKRTAALLATAFVFAVGGAYAGADSQTGVISAGAYSAQQQAELTGVNAAVTSHSAVLSWNKQSDVKTYSVHSKDKNGKLTLLLNTGSSAVCIPDLEPKTQYNFVVTGQTDSDDVMIGSASVKTADKSADEKLDKNILKLSVKGLEAESGIDSVTLDWESTDGIISYDVYVKNANGKLKLLESTYESSVTLGGLDSGTEYTFAVKGRAVSKTTKASEITVSTQQPPKAADEIENISIEDISVKPDYDNVQLSWEKVKGVETYNVYIGNDREGYTFAASTDSDTVTVDELAPGTEYSFLIRGQTGGRYTQNSYAVASTLGIESLKITGLNAEPDYDKVTLSWNEQKGVDTYNIYVRCKNGTFAFKTYTRSTSITLTGLDIQTKYTYCIKGQANGKYTQSSKITFRTLGVSDQKIENLKAEATETSVTLKWTALDGADSYNVYIRQADGKYKYLKSVRQNTAVISGLKSATSYTFAVRAKKSGKLTALCSVKAATLRTDVTIKFEKLNQLGGKGNSGKVKATYGCGGTSVTMLLNAKGLNLNKDIVLRKQYTNGWCSAFCPIPFPYGASNWGSLMCNLVDLAKSYGFSPKVNTAPTGTDIKRVLNGDNLVLVGLRTASGAYHFQIIYGYYVQNGVTYFRMHDPYGNYCVDWTEAYLKKRIYSVNMNDWYTKQVRGIMWL